MTWSLKLKNGDLERNGSQLAKATNEVKMVQDLRIQFLQKMGIDDLHPDFGSLLDGGVTTDGIVHESLIGTPDRNKAKLSIESEIYRVINDYQARQLSRAKMDKMVYGKATLTQREVVLSVDSINISDNLDAIDVSITITTGAKTLQNIELSVSN
jgi:hypothetical protein